MCGRIALYTPPQRLARLLEAAVAVGLDPEDLPSWNVGPQRTLFGVSQRSSGRVLDGYRWGLVPWWAKDTTGSNRLFNARAETVATKPSFRDAFERHRLLVPVDGFYEWDRRGAAKVPHLFTRADEGLLVLAGLSERWRDPAGPPDAPVLRTCTILTTTPSADVDGIHDRMPVVLDPAAYDLWLTARDDELDAVTALCAPAPAGTLVHHAVDAKVGNVRNDGPELIAAVPS
ncbi:MAG TPA: SOS response-associated peptidase [Acidimicrobiales bacterium]